MSSYTATYPLILTYAHSDAFVMPQILHPNTSLIFVPDVVSSLAIPVVKKATVYMTSPHIKSSLPAMSNFMKQFFHLPPHHQTMKPNPLFSHLYLLTNYPIC